MLRESYVKKYEEKSKFDNDNRFLKEEDDYVINDCRPLAEKTIRNLSHDHLEKFVEDIMTNKKLTTILYSSNANIEIQRYLKTMKALQKNNPSRPVRKEPENTASTVAKNRLRQEAYAKIQVDLKEFKIETQDSFISKTKINDQRYKKFKAELRQERDKYFEPMKNNRKKQYLKTFVSVRNRFNHYKEKDPQNIDATIMKTDSSLISKQDPIFYTEKQKFTLPKIKLDNDDVYSRLYHNSVNLTNANQATKDKDNQCLTNASKVKRNSIHFSSFTELENYDNGQPSSSRRNKPNFNMKKVLKSSNGKEFTVKITDDLIKKCFFKYSGGPEVIKMIKEHLLDDIKKEKKLREDEIDYFEIVTEDGNYLLHIIARENQYEMAEYFLDKGADPNVQNAAGETPLHIATRDNNRDMMALLLEHGASSNISNAKGEVPYELASPELKKLFKQEKNRLNKEKS